jgi:hypothetical protein
VVCTAAALAGTSRALAVVVFGAAGTGEVARRYQYDIDERSGAKDVLAVRSARASHCLMSCLADEEI